MLPTMANVTRKRVNNSSALQDVLQAPAYAVEEYIVTFSAEGTPGKLDVQVQSVYIVCKST